MISKTSTVCDLKIHGKKILQIEDFRNVGYQAILFWCFPLFEILSRF